MKSWLSVATVVLSVPLLMFSLAACRSATETKSPEPSPAARGADSDPWAGISTFRGTIPCASCPGIEMIVQLKPDGTFFLRSLYLEASNGEDRMQVDMGRWALTVDNDMLILRAGTEGVQRWSVVGSDTLRKLSYAGGPIESNLPYELVRSGDSKHISGSGPMSGMYRYMADAALFEECRTRTRYPVVFEEAHIDLERAYLMARQEPGQPLMAAFDGRIELRPKIEGEGEREFVIVSAFNNLVPGESCFDNELSLEGTIWNLIELNGRPLELMDETRIPQVVLISEDDRAEGTGGCNRFAGGYEVSGDSLSFGQMASTMMACPDGMERETAFLQALGATTNFDMYGNMLELWSAGRFMARLEGFLPEELME